MSARSAPHSAGPRSPFQPSAPLPSNGLPAGAPLAVLPPPSLPASTLAPSQPGGLSQTPSQPPISNAPLSAVQLLSH